ncbi:MAG: Trm112 family protein [Gemmatimonadaceae bacterium]|nr:Trm112 family protein [Gemmatimonadaceae bacterium]
MRAHEDSWLVARVDELVDRHVVSGELGCPVCGTRYPVREGVADFSLGATPPSGIEAGESHEARERLAVRAAALLGLTEPGGIVVLAGEWSAAAHEILTMTENVQLLALDSALGLRSGGALSLALIAELLPLAHGSVRGIALDARHATPSLTAGAARALIPGGRLLAPVSALLPESLQELARDDEHWLATTISQTTVSAPVAIGTRR